MGLSTSLTPVSVVPPHLLFTDNYQTFGSLQPITLIIPLQILFSMPALIPFNSFVLRLNQTSLPSRKQSPTGLSHHTLHFPPIALPYFASSSLYIVIVLVSSFLFYHPYLLA